MAELYGTLADVKMALTDAKEALHDKDKKVRELETIIESLKTGENCPICESGRMKVAASRPHPTFAFAGTQEHTLTCQNADCDHNEKHNYDLDN